MCWDFAGLGETEAERKLQEMASLSVLDCGISA